MFDEYRGKRIAVLGYGVEGQSSVRYFLSRGAVGEVHDDKPAGELGASYQTDVQGGVVFCLEEQAFKRLNEVDMVVRSPGIPPHHPGLEQVRPGTLTSQTALFLQRWRRQSVGVTGTKGKGTTVTILARLLEAAGRTVHVGGNIGRPLLDFMDILQPDDIAVLELSSFQLQDVPVSPHVAVVLRMTEEHLNYHGSPEAYRAAKASIVRHQQVEDVAVINVDSPMSAAMVEETHAQVYGVGRQPGLAGAQIDGEVVRLQLPDTNEVVARLDQLQFRGRHNLENVAAAALAARLLGVSVEQVRKTLPLCRPLPHRLELVGTAGNIAFYNDSFSTTPESTMAAVRSFTEPLVCLLGGSDKGAAYAALAHCLAGQPHMVGVVVVGATGPAMRRELELAGCSFPVVDGGERMPEMVEVACRLLRDRSGHGVVLLSPAAASFGLFRDYKDRGDQFRLAAQCMAGVAVAMEDHHG